ncbi:aminoimidazole riboside kinase [Budviciaceae bacterium BWR-B9]|uniref:Aminoimidazole riboside kinase n=1 Tax=Limnobaculum allomyrinae TaxID=2791986 RepID=A0ABS1IPK1_9GAMM|nr:aminoimidazole riboside kinase [Limnobaculum allomyrinae]MBV7691375.1 aminoimidazole riboside kinase [Limnobaculum sp. M2-1]
MKIWSLGDVVVDLLPLENMQYQACAGGAPANVAVGIARLGYPSGFIGRIGKDPFGRFMAESLAREGVDCQCIEQDDRYKTSTVIVDLAASGERSFTFLVSPSADQFLSLNTLPDTSAAILHTCSLALTGKVCRDSLLNITRQVKQQGGIVSFDLNLRAQMWADKQEMHQIIAEYCTKTDVLKLSEEELFWLTQCADDNWPEALGRLKDFPAALVVITRGKQGCLVLCQNTIHLFNSYAVTSVDTTGAGDAFMAGLLAGIARFGIPGQKNESPETLSQIISQASACGALSTTHKGAWAALPNQNQLQHFLSTQGMLKPGTR